MVLARMKKHFETISCLGYRYTGIEEYKSALSAEIVVKPLKRKKKYSFINPENIIQVLNGADEGITNIQ